MHAGLYCVVWRAAPFFDDQLQKPRCAPYTSPHIYTLSASTSTTANDAGMLLGMSFRDLKDYALDHGATMREVDRAVDRGALLHVISAAHRCLPEQFHGPIRAPEQPMGKSHAQVQFELNKAKRDKSHPRRVDEPPIINEDD